MIVPAPTAYLDMAGAPPILFSPARLALCLGQRLHERCAALFSLP